MSGRTLIIRLEDNSDEGDGHSDVTIVEHVLDLMLGGFTSGYQPAWEKTETDPEKAGETEKKATLYDKLSTRLAEVRIFARSLPKHQGRVIEDLCLGWKPHTNRKEAL